MKLPQKILIEYSKKIFSDVHSAIVGIIVSAIILSILGSIYVFAKNLWTMLIHTMQTPTPLWATIVLVFVVVGYIYLKNQKKIQTSKTSNHKICYFTIGDYKWEVKVYKDGFFEVEKYPFCPKHDLRFIYGNNRKYCPGTETESCKNYLSEYDEFTVYESAKSLIENKIRNKKC